jgi:hypothetical protein
MFQKSPGARNVVFLDWSGANMQSVAAFDMQPCEPAKVAIDTVSRRLRPSVHRALPFALMLVIVH